MIKDSGAKKPPDPRLGSVLALLTARFAGPALILVTAAMPEDDTRRVATSVAQVLQSTGKRAAYATLGSSPLALDEDDEAAGFDVLRPALAALTSPAAFDATAALWRAEYDFVLVDAPTLLETTLVPHIARTANGVLIAMRRGRTAGAEDRKAAAILKHLGALTIGIVTTPPRSAHRGGSLAPRTAARPHTTITSAPRAQPIES